MNIREYFENRIAGNYRKMLDSAALEMGAELTQIYETRTSEACVIARELGILTREDVRVIKRNIEDLANEERG